MKRRSLVKIFKYISGNITVRSEIELNDEQLIKIYETAVEIRISMSQIHSNQIAERIYNDLKDNNISSVEIFYKNEKIKEKILVRIQK